MNVAFARIGLAREARGAGVPDAAKISQNDGSSRRTRGRRARRRAAALAAARDRGRRGAAASYEAVWTDGLPYVIAGRPKPRADGRLDVTFADGAKAAVDAVAAVLSPEAWRGLARLPDGCWCRPIHWEPEAHWGLVVGASRGGSDWTYEVRMDGEVTTVRVAADALDPILLVRGDGRDAWQRGLPASCLRLC